MTIALSKLNFRDLGGLPTQDARRVRHGLLFRSEGPASFFDDHRAELGALGIRSVCDLRSAGERDTAPNDWCGPECRILNLDMNTDLRAQGEDIWESLRRDPSAENARRVMTENYRMMPQALEAHMLPLVDALLNGDVPMIVHCTAGKDRTGVVIALLLALLGVGMKDILHDYGKSDIFGENMQIAGSIEDCFLKCFGFVPEAPVVAMLIGTEQEFLKAALQQVDSRWGGATAYFDAVGVDVARQEALRTMMLEPA